MKFVFALALVALYVALMGARPNVEINHRAVRGAGDGDEEGTNGGNEGGKVQHPGQGHGNGKGRPLPASKEEKIKAKDRGEKAEEEAEAEENTDGDRKKRSANSNDHKRSKRAAFKAEYVKWPRGDIPYGFAAGFGDNSLKALVKEAADEWNSKAGLNIHEMDGECNGIDCIIIFEGQGCWSYIGKQKGEDNAGENNQISLGTGCGVKGVILHEMAHAFGLEHEHKRVDRDKYVKVHANNIVDGKQGQFKKNSKDGHKSIFDPCGIMQYQPDAFCKTEGQATLSLLNNDNDLQCMGSQKGLSLLDGMTVAEEYDFIDKAASKTCKYGGYRLKKKTPEEKTTCICSNVYEGDDCSKTVEGRHCGKQDFKLDGNKAAYIKTPNYDGNNGMYEAGASCTWTFVQSREAGEPEKKLCLYFPDGWDIEPAATTGSGKEICYYAVLSVLDGIFRTEEAKSICGTQEFPEYMLMSLPDQSYGPENNREPLRYDWGAVHFGADKDSWPQRGFDAFVAFAPKDSTITDCKTIIDKTKQEAAKTDASGGQSDGTHPGVHGVDYHSDYYWDKNKDYGVYYGDYYYYMDY